LLSGQRAEPSQRREKAYWYKREGNKMEDAGRVRGAKEVKNEIVVDLAAQQALDGDVAKAAEASLQANSLVPKGALRVSVDDG